MKSIKIYAMAMMSLIALSAAAQNNAEPTLTVKPTGRILMDGALYGGPENDMFDDGVAITDARLGVKATYGKWSAKIDVGFAYGKVGLKDILMQYTYDADNFLRLGSFIHQYGLQSATSSSMKCSMEEPTSNEVFNNPRQIGAMYVHSEPQYLGTLSAHVEPNAAILTPNQTSEQGYGFMTRQVWRPIVEDGMIVQVGISGGYTTPRFSDNDQTKSNHNTIQMSGNFPTRVDKVTAVNVTVDEAKNMFKFTPEVLVSYGPVAVESQYFYNQVNRKHDLDAFVGQGAYVTLRGLLNGDNYGYSMLDGGLATPKAGTFECVLNYNYTTLSDKAYKGGRLNDISCTFNYYINKYMIARLRAAYTHRWDYAGGPDVDLTSIQGRLQIIF